MKHNHYESNIRTLDRSDMILLVFLSEI